MEERCNTEKLHDTLDLDAPLLSTRRLGGLNSTSRDKSWCSLDGEEQRVPFLWERVPGKPKDVVDSSCNGHVEEPPMPLPKPPPCRWHPPAPAPREDDLPDEGDEEEEEEDDDMFLDAIDRMSLSGSLDNHCSTSRASGLDGLDLKAIQSCGDESPNFIMTRFLPAATALAASSSLLNASRGGLSKKEIGCRLASGYHDQPTPVGSRYGRQHGVLYTQSPPKACGLMLFFPWSLKHALSGLKKPIPSCSPRLRLRRNGRRTDAVRGDEGPSRNGWM